MNNTLTTENLRIGWIGTGIMGNAMAARLLLNGFHLAVFNRTASKAHNLVDKGAILASSPAEVAAQSHIVFTMVSYPHDVENVILGKNGVMSAIQPGGIICDMTTSSPDIARKIAQKGLQSDIAALDAPVTGGDTGALNGTLSIFAGGDKKAFDRVFPLLQLLGKTIMHCGDAGTGQLAKLANQVNVAGVTFGVCESLLFAQQAGLDVNQWLELVVQGSGGSTSMNTRGRRLLAGDYQPGFIIDHFVKDLGLCLAECRRMGIVLPCTQLAEEFYRIMQAQGSGKLGTQALVCCLAKLSGKHWKPT